ncbi:MAG: 2-C-methyl-D-erythritol 2,4-cyclodiphosphate synthase [Candidatus Aminicenantes bacterium]|nr:2-C-methyl-D-erythritol 2,4-cyclodiphosphate synthase [Candidatus Aminicenantes bacterium]
MRIGLGYDVHRLTAGRPLYLGGIRIPHDKGLLGHSDGDVIIHAVIDALLGASGEGDIGRLFPDSDPGLKDVRSVKLLKDVVSRLRKKRLRVDHVDVIVVAESPRLGPYFEAMKEVLAPLLGVPLDRLGLKAKTNEGLGDIGRGRAIACWAVASLRTGSRSYKRD